MMLTEPGDTKDQQRRFFAQRRENLSLEKRQQAADHLAGHLRPWLLAHCPQRRITATLPFGAELPLLPLWQQLVEEDHFEVLVPVCLPQRAMEFTPWFPGVQMQRCAYAPIDEPVGPRFSAEVFNDVDVMLVPAQAIDDTGQRLGHGGGYYDRFLAAVQDLAHPPVLIGVVYEQEFVPAGTFDTEAHDIAVAAVVTELGFHWFSPT